MIEHSESFGNLRIYQAQADGWVTGIYNTFVKYSEETLAVKYHQHESRKSDKRNPDDGIYNLMNGHDIMGQCSLCKDLLNDVTYLKIKMETKTSRGITYNFDMEFIGDILKKTVNAVHKKIESIYFDMNFDAVSKGKTLNIPLPDYTTENTVKESENENNKQDEIIELIKKDTSFIIEIIEELKQKNIRPGYIEKLIEGGFLYDDGKRVISGLNETASELVDITGHPVTWEYLKETFLKTDGSMFSDISCKSARDYANTKGILKT
jgi:hypothetical protein